MLKLKGRNNNYCCTSQNELPTFPADIHVKDSCIPEVVELYFNPRSIFNLPIKEDASNTFVACRKCRVPRGNL
jgi:hypothetical protein